MPHELLTLDSQQVSDLFPFHLLVSSEGDCSLLSVGGALQKTLPDECIGQSINDYFFVSRPLLSTLTKRDLKSNEKSIFFLGLRDTAVKLRGEFYANSPSTYLFLGSILITAADSLDSINYELSDFSAFDVTPDILILHRFREIQIRDQVKVGRQLKNVIDARDRLDNFANTDMLTEILNRRGFWTQANKILNSPIKDRIIAILVLDLDGFKAINDTYGHEMGDEVLREVAKRLTAEIYNDGVVGRLGGDEFIAMIELPAMSCIEKRTDRILNSVNQPMLAGQVELSVMLSAGATLVTEHMAIEEAIRNADIAMYEGRKSPSKPGVFWFTDEIQQQLKYREKLALDLELAIGSGLIVPHFQPIYRLHDAQLTCFEALARWQHSELGFISPEVFIKLADEVGLLPRLDFLMLEQALDQLAHWQSYGKSYGIHVNLTSPSLQADLPKRLRALLQRKAIDPSQLVLELTETTLLENTDLATSVINEITDDGVRFQLDDFGTGFSSLTHLQEFPVSGIKIDRSFVMDALSSDRAGRLLIAIVDIAKTLQMDVVGEGVETLEQLQLLQCIGCQYGQGYYLGKPARAEDCEVLLHDWQHAA